MSLAARLLHPSTLLLIAANLLPLAGILFWHWDVFILLVLYWMETAIVGFWTIVAIAVAPIMFPSGKSRTSPFFLVPFFIVHSGIFMVVHFLFLWSLFSGRWPSVVHNAHDFLQRIVIGLGLWIPLAALFISRGVSFFYLMFGARFFPAWLKGVPRDPSDERLSEGTLLGRFYQRIVIMHLTILFGAAVAIALGSAGPLVVMVALKIAIDVTLHLKNDFPVEKPVVLTTV
jgi:hypothetical protein